MQAKRAETPVPKTTRKPRKSRVFSISVPPEIAEYAEAVAREESRTMSEVFRDAMRCYQSQRDRTRRMFEEIREYVKTLPPTPYTEDDVVRLVKEVRAEMRAEREALARKAG